jgi:NitT/TauT family transport system ATP-binding protein
MDNLIFKNLTLKIPKGEFTCIFGPSGCGKTTLLNIISGLDNEYNGKVDFNNKSLKSKENKIGYMFQSPRLFPWLTAIENIRFPIKKKNSLSNARLLLKMVGLEKFENSYPHKL